MITTETALIREHLALDSGVNQYVTKPYTSEHLIEALNRALNVDSA